MRPFDPRLLRIAPGARRPVAVLAVVGVLQGVSTIALAFALTALAVAVVRSQPLGTPATWVAGIFLARAALGWLSERVAAWAGVEVSAALRHTVVSRWLSRPAEDRPDPDRAVTLAAQGCSTVEPYAARYLPALVAAAVVPVLAIGALVWVDWLSALIVVLTLPLLPLFAALIGQRTQHETDRRWRALAALSGHFLDVMRGLPTLAACGRAERQVDVIREVSEKHRRATMRTLRIAFLSSAALELLASISVAIVAVSVGLRLTYGTMDLSAGLLAILLAPEAYWPVRKVGQEFHAAADGADAIDGLLAGAGMDGGAGEDARAGSEGGASLGAGGSDPGAPAALGARDDRPDDPSGGRGGDRTDATVRGVHYTYPGADRPVLAGVDLDAGPGLTVLTGTSGVGKSTLLEIIAGLRRPDSGTVDTGRAHLVSQRPFLTAGSVGAALRLGTSAADDALWVALRQVGLDGFVAGLPQALATPIGDDGFGLSAGQRARLALARATLSTAPVILLDEPTAHLDESATAITHDVITRLAERHTVVAVTHRAELVALADRHVHLTPVGAEVTAR